MIYTTEDKKVTRFAAVKLLASTWNYLSQPQSKDVGKTLLRPLASLYIF